MDEKSSVIVKKDKTTDMTAEEVAQDYICNKSCRICPYPGLKCVQNQETWRRIK